MTADNKMNMPPEPELSSFRVNLRANGITVEGDALQNDGAVVVISVGAISKLVIPAEEVLSISQIRAPTAGS